MKNNGKLFETELSELLHKTSEGKVESIDSLHKVQEKDPLFSL